MHGEDNRAAKPGATMTAYDPENIFAKILRGEIPCHKIYEDRVDVGAASSLRFRLAARVRLRDERVILK